MLQFLLLLALGGLAYMTGTKSLSLYRNVQKARSTGLPYRIVPVYNWSRPWMMFHRLIIRAVLVYLPPSWTEWVNWCVPELSTDWGHSIFKEIGSDTFLLVSPGTISVQTCDAAVISQITTRRNDFPKPIDTYRALDIYGKNVVTLEGSMWRHHRKAISPPFTEKNNQLVWLETIDQASAMLNSWIGPNRAGNKSVAKTSKDTMRLSLNVISRAGFGRKVEWPANDPESKTATEKVQTDVDPGHQMGYFQAIHDLLETILLQFLLPKNWLQNLPLGIAKKASMAYHEWKGYMEEAVEQKKTEVRSDTTTPKNQMDLLGQLVKSQLDPKNANPLEESEILGNMFVLILAGHETAANVIHFSIVFLALYTKSQRALQKDLDQAFAGRPPSEWDYDQDLGALFGGMTGAVMNETLRVIPAVPSIPKSTFGVPDQDVTIDEKSYTIPGESPISLAAFSAHRNPKYWPLRKPTLPGGKTAHPIANLDNDLEEYHPERWFEGVNKTNSTSKTMTKTAVEGDDLQINTAADTSEFLYHPVKGSYVPFSEGYRACIGRRFAQVEILAALAVLFQNYSVELAVDEFASDEEVEKMNEAEKADVWQKTANRARDLLLKNCSSIISLQLRGEQIPVRWVPRGKERFPTDVDDIWKKNHPDLCQEAKAVPGWKPWDRRKPYYDV